MTAAPVAAVTSLVRVFEHYRLEQDGHAGGGGDRRAESNLLRLALRVRLVRVGLSAQAVDAVDLCVDGGRRLAHVGRGELPVVARVERGRVEDEDGRFRLPPPVVELRLELRPVLRPAAALAEERVDDEVVHVARLLLLLAPSVVNARVKLLLVEFAEPERARVAGLEDHLQVCGQARGHAHAYVALHAGDEALSDAPDDLHVVLRRDLFVAPAAQEVLHFEVVMRADDRAPGDAGDDLDAAQHVQFGEAGEHADVEERGAEAAARKCEAHFALEAAAHGAAAHAAGAGPPAHVQELLKLQPRSLLLEPLAGRRGGYLYARE